MELTLDQALQKGIEAHKAGKVQEADRYYTAILKANPKHPDASHNMGVLAVGLGKVETALPFFKTALEVNSNIAQYWLSYIDALIRLDRLADAKAIFDQAKNNGAKGDGFDQLEKRLVDTENATTSNAQEPPEDQLQDLINLHTQGQHREALNKGSQLLRQFPNSINLYNIIGSTNKSLGKLDEAIEAYTKAISIKPDYADAYNNMGNALKDQGKLDQAIEAYTKALTHKPDYAEAYTNMGNALKEQGKIDQAIEAYNKALTIKPDYAEVYNEIGLAFQNQSMLDDAINSYKKALSIKPDYAKAYNNMGIALQDQERLDEAVEYYKKALSIKPNYAKAYNNMGIALQDQGKLDKAVEAYTQALSIKHDFTDAIENASSLRTQIAETTLMNEEFGKKLQNNCSELISAPKFQINQAVRAFLISNQKVVRKHLNSYNSCLPSSIAELKAKDQVFCSAYNRFLQKLIEEPLANETTIANDQSVFHLGESHCLSYAHRFVKIHGTNYMIKPRITFGGKAYHFSTQKENSYKAITGSNFDSLPDNSIVFISFGEIDCRPDEGFISAAKQHKKPIEDLVSDTVRGYVDWFVEQNQNKNHSLFFFNVPAPIYKKKYSTELNGKVANTIKLFNRKLHKTISDYDFNIIDVHKFTVGRDGYSNGLFHIDGFHLSSDAIPGIEKQIGSFM